MRDNQFGKYKPAFWSEYGDKIINEFSLKLTSKGEYHGACPSCGGTDRFWIKEVAGEVKVHCRQCNDFPEITKILRSMGLWPAIVEGAPAVPVGNLHDFEDHTPYHVRKGVGLGSAKLEGNNVVIPIYSAEGKTVGTQTITPRGDKRFTAGMAKEGAFGVVGGAIEGVCYIAEGWATAASVSASTGRPAIFALDAGNLPKVAAVLKEIRPNAQLIVAADNDEPGIKAAEETGLPWAAPKRPRDDWNDVMLNLGQLAVKKGLERALLADPGSLEHFKAGAFKASDLQGKDVPERTWHVQDLIPDSTVTLFSGDGGTGKSLVALQLAMSTALGVSWLTNAVRQGKALYLSAEDDTPELHRRVSDIATAYMAELSDLSDLTLRSMAGEDALLATLATGGTLQTTKLFETISDVMGEIKPKLLVLDTLADYFPGNENDRAQARQFIGMLRGLAIQHECAIVLLAHPSLSGMGSGTGTSGSTAWNNSVRSRLYLTRVLDDGYEQNPDVRVLKTMKANYGRIGGELSLTWRDGVFVADAPVTGIDRMAAGAKAERVFLKLLREFSEQGRKVNHAGGPTYAPKVFAGLQGAEGVTRQALKSAMEALLQSGKIQLAESGPPSKRRQYLEVAK